jgi:hypothetical protein
MLTLATVKTWIRKVINEVQQCEKQIKDFQNCILGCIAV